MSRRRVSGGLLGASWAAGLVVGAIGAMALKPRRAAPSPDAALATGRGAPKGPVDPAARTAGYELGDADVRTLVVIMIVSVVLIVAGIAGVFTMVASFDRHFRADSAALTREQRAPIPPPRPNLQADPYRDLDILRREQGGRLTTYGYAAPDRREPHIPIERAMQQVIGRPLDAATAGGRDAETAR